MTKTRKQWKTEAKFALQGNYSIAILGMLATLGVNLLGSIFSDYFFPGNTVVSLILGEVFLFLFSLILSIFTTGYSLLLMNLSRHQQAGLGDLLYFFQNQPDRVIVAGFVMALLQLLASTPSLIYSYTSEMGASMEAQMNWMMNFLILTVVSAILQLLLTMPFALSYYLLADENGMSGMQSLKVSASMMKGHLGQYLILQASFFPMIFFSAFLLYIPLLWVIPYMEMANVEFYRDLRGEFLQEQVVDSTDTGSYYGY